MIPDTCSEPLAKSRAEGCTESEDRAESPRLSPSFRFGQPRCWISGPRQSTSRCHPWEGPHWPLAPRLSQCRGGGGGGGEGPPPPPAAARRPEARPESRQSCAAQSVQVTKPRPGQSRDGPAKTKKHMKKAPSVKRTSRTSPSFTPAVYTATLFSTQRQHKDRCPADFNVPRFCSSTLHSSRPPAPALSAFT